MAAANPAQRTTATGLAPYYRRYELPWSPSEEMERRFRTILRNLVIAFAIIAVLMPFLPRHKQITNTDSLPERVVQLVMEPPPPPPPPPPPKPEKPLEKAPLSPKPVPQPVDPRIKASKSGLLASMDDLAALRDIDLDKFAKNQPKTTDPGDVSLGAALHHHLESRRYQRRHQCSHQQRPCGGIRFIERHPHGAGEGSDPGFGQSGRDACGRQRQGLSQRGRNCPRIYQEQGRDRFDVCAGVAR